MTSDIQTPYLNHLPTDKKEKQTMCKEDLEMGGDDALPEIPECRYCNRMPVLEPIRDSDNWRIGCECGHTYFAPTKRMAILMWASAQARREGDSS